MSDLRVHVHREGKKTAQLICNWCGLPHDVEPEYKAEVLERGRKEIEENKKELEKAGLTITPEQTWTCGACFLYLRLPDEGKFLIDGIKTECDHEVPKERVDAWANLP
jgi:hypothetical protein